MPQPNDHNETCLKIAVQHQSTQTACIDDPNQVGKYWLEPSVQKKKSSPSQNGMLSTTQQLVVDKPSHEIWHSLSFQVLQGHQCSWTQQHTAV